MWKCKKCGEELEDSFDSCWKCNTPDDGSSPRLTSSPISTTKTSRSEQGSLPSTTSVTQRYSDAYLMARTINGIGTVVKLIAIILCGCILLGSIIEFSKESVLSGFAVIIAAFVTAIPIYILGVLAAALGEILKATLDTAVTNSPFLKKEEMAKVMSL